ncbi:hypothetical protein M3Y98_00969900 [Aphelenchoides besseyi]|nr:hypothetical protein M3Y98_00969900 [Aphelenchoides besseyi]
MSDHCFSKTEPVKKSRIPKIVQRVVKSDSNIPVPICAAKVVDSLTLLTVKNRKENEKELVKHDCPTICYGISNAEECRCKEYVNMSEINSDWESARETRFADESNTSSSLTSWHLKFAQNSSDISVTNYLRLLESVADEYVRLNKKLTSQQSFV